MMEHVLQGLEQVLGDGVVEEAAGLLEWPLVVGHHPLGADKPQPEDKK